MRVQVGTVDQLLETTVVHRRLAPYDMDVSKCDSLLRNPSLKSVPAAPGRPCEDTSLLQTLPLPFSFPALSDASSPAQPLPVWLW